MRTRSFGYRFALRLATALILFAVVQAGVRLGPLPFDRRQFVLAGAVVFLACAGVHRSRQLGVALTAVGLAFVVIGVVCSSFWPSHSLLAAFSLDPSISIFFIGDIAIGYALLLCGFTSYIWGVLTGQPSVRARWRTASFTVESETPDHVIHVDTVARPGR